MLDPCASRTQQTGSSLDKMPDGSRAIRSQTSTPSRLVSCLTALLAYPIYLIASPVAGQDHPAGEVYRERRRCPRRNNYRSPRGCVRLRGGCGEIAGDENCDISAATCLERMALLSALFCVVSAFWSIAKPE